MADSPLDPYVAVQLLLYGDTLLGISNAAHVNTDLETLQDTVRNVRLAAVKFDCDAAQEDPRLQRAARALEEIRTTDKMTFAVMKARMAFDELRPQTSEAEVELGHRALQLAGAAEFFADALGGGSLPGDVRRKTVLTLAAQPAVTPQAVIAALQEAGVAISPQGLGPELGFEL
jgi:hypothetical protein